MVQEASQGALIQVRPEAVTEVKKWIQEHVEEGSQKGFVIDGVGVEERTIVKDNPHVLIYATQW